VLGDLQGLDGHLTTELDSLRRLRRVNILDDTEHVPRWRTSRTTPDAKPTKSCGGHQVPKRPRHAGPRLEFHRLEDPRSIRFANLVNTAWTRDTTRCTNLTRQSVRRRRATQLMSWIPRPSSKAGLADRSGPSRLSNMQGDHLTLKKIELLGRWQATLDQLEFRFLPIRRR
jgi:hypothetical protein